MVNGTVPRLSIMFKALRELGPKQLGLYALYRLRLESGWLRWKTGDWEERTATPELRRAQLAGVSTGPRGEESWLALPEANEVRQVIGEQGAAQVLEQAGEIAAGKARLFGGEPAPLNLEPDWPLAHWTAYEQGRAPWGAEDVKLVWEPARFGWAFTLARAYTLTGDAAWAEVFWRHTETFLRANPPNRGPNWASAQEVALRLIALAFARQVFAPAECSTPERLQRLDQALAAHAQRIPPTLIYARSQHNNHLLTEAAGLYTAAACLPEHPEAGRWRALGWKWLNLGLQEQISPEGAYSQHSANYQRLMLQTALWAGKLAAGAGQDWPQETLEKLGAATRWLLKLVDPASGRTPNLGPNDGAYILPLTVCPFHDYRPALQTASLAFLGQPAFEPGPWDEMSLWLAADAARHPRRPAGGEHGLDVGEAPIRLEGRDSWAYLRVARFTSRPGHADQLHLDLWWRGSNVAQDAGTYFYNAPPPWDNALMGTAAHNTVMVAGRDQMTRAGRFLYLDWAQGRVIEHTRAEDGSFERLAAEHDGYRGLGVVHRRSVERGETGWRVEDRVLPLHGSAQAAGEETWASIHWLLPDWPYQVETGAAGWQVRLESPQGTVRLSVQAGPGELVAGRLVRAGELVAGEGPAAVVEGWVSPTYAHKIPALSLRLTARGRLPVGFVSTFSFP